MTRLISLGMILGLVAVFGLLSLRVMAAFLLPLLLAAMLVVIVGPLHRRLRDRLRMPEWVAAALTTAFVLLLVLAPVSLLLFRAVGEASKLVHAPGGLRLDPAVLDGLVARVGEATGLQLTAESVNAEIGRLAEEGIGPVVKRAPVVLLKLVIGLLVMTVSLFYFLADGRRMLEGVTRLVPLDTRYQWQLLEEFEEVSRAVVSSTLLGALVQALLAGIGFAWAGLGNVFLLTILTFFGALVPFVGAAAVWVTASLYLLFFVKDAWAAAGLVAWGLCVVSTIDNVVKPMVLQGQSKLHPLLALLSVLGGVGALGPIGIFVGPIAVAFLQAALTMLQVELDTMAAGSVPAETGENQGPREPPRAGVAEKAAGTLKSS